MYGPQVLSGGKDADVDIILVHGLGGHREQTWTKRMADGTTCFWPKDLLSEDLPNARIISWGYEAAVIRPARVVSIANLTQHAQKLCTEIANLRQEDESERPIIFISHSMGGVLTKKALLHSTDSNPPEIAAIVKNTSGIMFMGTPHFGSQKADIGAFLVALLSAFHQSNSTFLKDLEKENPNLQELERRFNMLLTKRNGAKRPIQIGCFCESVPINGITGLIVSDFSAAPPNYEVCVSVPADHINMMKFSGREDQNYQNVLAELKRMIAFAMDGSKKKRENTGKEGKDEEEGQIGQVRHVGNNTHGALANYGQQHLSRDGIQYGNYNVFN